MALDGSKGFQSTIILTHFQFDMDNDVCNDDIDSTSTNNEVGDLQAGNSNIEESSVNNSSVAKIKLRLGLPFPDKESFDSDAFPRMLCNTSSVAFTLG